MQKKFKATQDGLVKRSKSMKIKMENFRDIASSPREIAEGIWNFVRSVTANWTAAQEAAF